MSYCLSINTDEGLVLCATSFDSDESYNATPQIDRMQRFMWPGNRFITILSSGNQETIAGVLNKVRYDLDNQSTTSLLTTSNMIETADYIAAISVEQQKKLRKKQDKPHVFNANFIVAGQMVNQAIETLLIYTEGNYIHESHSSPFLQIGEMKFGKTILDRIVKRDVSLNTVAHGALVSVDSTIRGISCKKMRTELMIYKKNTFEMNTYLSLDESSAFFKSTSIAWNKGIISALESLPRFDWET